MLWFLLSQTMFESVAYQLSAAIGSRFAKQAADILFDVTNTSFEASGNFFIHQPLCHQIQDTLLSRCKVNTDWCRCLNNTTWLTQHLPDFSNLPRNVLKLCAADIFSRCCSATLQ